MFYRFGLFDLQRFFNYNFFLFYEWYIFPTPCVSTISDEIKIEYLNCIKYKTLVVIIMKWNVFQKPITSKTYLPRGFYFVSVIFYCWKLQIICLRFLLPVRNLLGGGVKDTFSSPLSATTYDAGVRTSNFYLPTIINYLEKRHNEDNIWCVLTLFRGLNINGPAQVKRTKRTVGERSRIASNYPVGR